MFRLCSRSVFGRSEGESLHFVLVRNGSLCCIYMEGEAVNIMSKTFEYLEISLLKYLEMYLMCSERGGVSTRSVFGERGGGGGEYHE